MRNAEPRVDPAPKRPRIPLGLATRERVPVERVARIVRQCLDRGTAVEIEGLGVFQPSDAGECEFLAYTEPRVFIAYVEEDAEPAFRLFDDLAGAGFSPWMDKKKLLPGQNWPRSIERAIDMADFALLLFSRRSGSKRGGFQAELRYSLDCTRRMPLDHVFIIPCRLEECAVPQGISREIQYVDLFPDWDRGVRRIAAAMRREMRRRQKLDPKAPAH